LTLDASFWSGGDGHASVEAKVRVADRWRRIAEGLMARQFTKSVRRHIFFAAVVAAFHVHKNFFFNWLPIFFIQKGAVFLIIFLHLPSYLLSLLQLEILVLIFDIFGCKNVLLIIY
jgi:hypothetical protein